ncbi:hypothetical protein G7Y89_g2551 [Cudoniella acicularis]|uniref:Phosphatidylinositol transfer protein SFH5 n=1 Tax=Cudoniella acicularis TaxID=354080 RepID=A0A8H4RU92_9HELO|nr:hypothetical protein G7Y89_g2551 [Cudoniella acicularis]
MATNDAATGVLQAEGTEPFPSLSETQDPGTSKEENPAPSVSSPPSSKLSAGLVELNSQLDSITKEAGYNEMWRITLTPHLVPTLIVLEKFLRANAMDVAAARKQLITALQWRAKMNPVKLLEEMEFDSVKFGGLGYVTVYPRADGKGKEVVTWNIYGSVKDNKTTFGDVDEFIKWRTALMELSIKELDLASATEPIQDNEEDPYRMVQVHDYLNVSFLRMDPNTKAASKETISTFSMAYPELLKEKFFVNVPLLMGWVFTAMKVFLSAATVKKFHPLSYGSSLAGELPEFGEKLPVAYGGKGNGVADGLTVKYAADSAEPKVEKDVAEPSS